MASPWGRSGKSDAKGFRHRWQLSAGAGNGFPGVLIEGSGGQGSFVRDAGILHGSFRIPVLIFQKANIEVNSLWSGGDPATPLQAVEGDS